MTFAVAFDGADWPLLAVNMCEWVALSNTAVFNFL